MGDYQPINQISPGSAGGRDGAVRAAALQGKLQYYSALHSSSVSQYSVVFSIALQGPAV